MKLLLSICLIFSLSTLAKEKKEHRHHEAHVHGGATLNIAFHQLKGKIEFKAASAGVLGFEHQAKSEKDKKTVSDAISMMETSIGKMVQFDSSLGCVITKEKIEIVAESSEQEQQDQKEKNHKEKGHGKHHAEHSDFVATYNVICLKSILGSKLTFDFTSLKKIKDLDVTVLADSLQKTAEVKSKPVVLELK